VVERKSLLRRYEVIVIINWDYCGIHEEDNVDRISIFRINNSSFLTCGIQHLLGRDVCHIHGKNVFDQCNDMSHAKVMLFRIINAMTHA
jgi:hypothetical protein